MSHYTSLVVVVMYGNNAEENFTMRIINTCVDETINIFISLLGEEDRVFGDLRGLQDIIDFTFTGRIKYIHHPKTVDVFFEVRAMCKIRIYNIKKRPWWLGGDVGTVKYLQEMRTGWVNSESIHISTEPKEVIVDCSQS